mmetsp:Transcript_31488/g.102591  ORF Transcript_31488/g.102591 Transcript_31488/m.102591 type:complete len:216 (-) Transcript_31488:910-1557(-)
MGHLLRTRPHHQRVHAQRHRDATQMARRDCAPLLQEEGARGRQNEAPQNRRPIRRSRDLMSDGVLLNVSTNTYAVGSFCFHPRAKRIRCTLVFCSEVAKSGSRCSWIESSTKRTGAPCSPRCSTCSSTTAALLWCFLTVMIGTAAPIPFWARKVRMSSRYELRVRMKKRSALSTARAWRSASTVWLPTSGLPPFLVDASVRSWSQKMAAGRTCSA